MSIKSKIQSLIAAANAKTGESDATLTDAVQTLVDGYGQGGGGDADLIDLIEGDSTTLAIPSGTTAIKANLFAGNSHLTAVTIPDSLTAIKASAFSGCTNLTTIIGGANVTTLNDYAFYNANHLSFSTFPFPNVAFVPREALRRCYALTDIIFPRAAGTTIGQGALQECTGLTSITILGPAGFAYTSCDKCTALKTIDIAAMKGTHNYYSPFSNCSALESFIVRSMPNGVPTIQSGWFNGTKIASGDGYIYVPDDKVDAVKAATNWSTYSARIRALSDYVA